MPAIKPRRYLTTVAAVEPGRIVLQVDPEPDHMPRAFTVSRSLLPTAAVGDGVVLMVQEMGDGRLRAEVRPVGKGKFDFGQQWGRKR